MPLPPEVSPVADRYASQQTELENEALGLLSQAHRTGNRDATTWRDAVAAIAERIIILQVAAAALADEYLTDVLEAQGADPAGDAQVNAEGFADYTDGGGSLLQFLVYAGNDVRASASIARLLRETARQRVEFVTSSILKTAMQDTGCGSVHSSMYTRPKVKGYVRMLRPPSCARCAILAGRLYYSSQAFRRHKRCACRHIPVAEDTDGDWTTNPVDYFTGLSREDQDRIFTKSGAEAIRLSSSKQATMNQVVNARKGMTTASFFGHDMVVTSEGTTQRGIFGRYVLDGPTYAEVAILTPGSVSTVRVTGTVTVSLDPAMLSSPRTR